MAGGGMCRTSRIWSTDCRREPPFLDGKNVAKAFTRIMRENIRNGDISFRRAYIRSVIDQVEVDDAEVRIHGRRTVLEKLVMSGGATPAGVPSFVRSWRARRDEDGHSYVIAAAIDF